MFNLFSAPNCLVYLREFLLLNQFVLYRKYFQELSSFHTNLKKKKNIFWNSWIIWRNLLFIVCYSRNRNCVTICLDCSERISIVGKWGINEEIDKIKAACTWYFFTGRVNFWINFFITWRWFCEFRLSSHQRWFFETDEADDLKTAIS